MKKKTKKQLRKTVKSLRDTMGDVSPAGLTAGAVAIGGLAASLARDPEIRRHARALAASVLEHLQHFVAGAERPEDEEEEEDAQGEELEQDEKAGDRDDRAHH